MADLVSMMYARKCDECGKGMNQGYLVNDEEYFCSDPCLDLNYDEDEYGELFESEDAFWTEWDALEEVANSGEYYTEAGKLVEVP